MNELSGPCAQLLQLKSMYLSLDLYQRFAQPNKLTKTIPIVMVTSVDPVGNELIVDTLARPGGNITGLAMLSRELSGKRLELFKEVVPRISRIGVLWDVDAPVSSFDL